MRQALVRAERRRSRASIRAAVRRLRRRPAMTGCVMPGPKCAVSRWPPPYSGC